MPTRIADPIRPAPAGAKPAAVDTSGTDAKQVLETVQKVVDFSISTFEALDPGAKPGLETARRLIDTTIQALETGFDPAPQPKPSPAPTPAPRPAPAPTPQPTPAPAPKPQPAPAPAPAPKPAPAPQPQVGSQVPQTDLKVGDHNANVDLLQQDLVKLGFMKESDRQTGPGIFGPHTEAAVRDFQAAWNLPVTGYYGPQSRAALQKALAGEKPPAAQQGNPAEIARRYLGKNAADLQRSSDLDMDKWPAATVDCANFVSAVLEKSGQIRAAEHNDNVHGLVSNLTRDGWKEVPLSQAKPGDVVTFDGPDGPGQHVELFNGWVNGKPQYIGSNNINSDGTQRISTDDGSWAYHVHVYQRPGGAPAPSPSPSPKPPPAPAPQPQTGVPTTDLREGDHNAQVELLQRDLVKLGYMSQADMNTGPGIFGPHTLAAVKKFQAAWKLPTTGFFGPMSRDAMGKALANQKPAPTPAPAPAPKPPPAPAPQPGTGVPSGDLKQGDHGAQVELLQRDLVKLGYLSQADMNTGPGIFGPHTLAAVQKFQAAWQLPTTGFFGPMSRGAMAKALAGQRPPAPSTPHNGNYPVWKQTDPRWSGMRLIDGTPGENIGPYGCAMTSTAMLLAASGRKINGQTIDSPVVLNHYLQQHQNPANTDNLEWYTAAGAVGFNAYRVSGSTLNNFLNQGHAVVMNIHNGGHWVLVTGRDSQGYICNDPATGTTRHLASWELNPWNGWAMY